MSDDGHVPVLLDEVVAALTPRPGEVYVDATAGLGGHASAVAAALGPAGTVVLNDADAGNLERASLAAGRRGQKVVSFHGNFANVPHRLREVGLRADMVLADLGFASGQVADPARGFSFQLDGPLDMRLDRTQRTTAADLVNTLPEHELAALIADYGEDRQARAIARKVVQARAAGPIATTGRLAEIVRSVCRPTGRIDPATRTFQALRIVVNDEIGSLEALLSAVRRDAERLAKGRAGDWLSGGARIAFISFHSLEDRPIKRAFEALVGQGLGMEVANTSASEEEVARNPRARSARLRAVRLTGERKEGVGSDASR